MSEFGLKKKFGKKVKTKEKQNKTKNLIICQNGICVLQFVSVNTFYISYFSNFNSMSEPTPEKINSGIQLARNFDGEKMRRERAS